MRRRVLPWITTLSIAATLAACGGETATPLGDSGVPDGTDAGVETDGGGITVGEITLSTTQVDFGKVVIGTSLERTVVVTNPQDHAVKVAFGALSGPDAATFTLSFDVPLDGNAVTLEAGTQATLTFAFSPEAAQRYVATLALDSCQGACPASIGLVAEGVLSGLVCPTSLDLGVANPGNCVDLPFACENQGNATESLINVSIADDPGGVFSVLINNDGSAAPGETLDFVTSFCPDANQAFTGTAVVVAGPGSEVVEQRVALTGRGGGPNVDCAPASLDLGVTGLGRALVGAVICTNTGVEEAQLGAALVAGGAFAVTSSASLSLAPGASTAVQVTFTPAALGVAQGTLRITSNDPDTPTVDVQVQAEAVDLLPCEVTAEPGTVDFGAVSLGDRRSLSVALANRGPTDCVVAAFVDNTAAPISVQLPTAPQTIAPGASLTFDVTFAPATGGAATASIAVTFLNPGSTDLVVDIQGEGATPPVTVEPYPVDFGGVAVGCASPETRSITIRRTAPGPGVVTQVELITSATTAFSLNPGPLPNTLSFLETMQVELTFTPPAVGTYSALIRIVSNNGPAVVVPVSAVGQPTSSRTDTVSMARPPVDVLFVVDDSGSMAAAQAALGQAIPDFVAAFANRGVDFQIGVVTTDMTDPAKSGRLQGTPTFVTPATPDLLDDLSGRLQPGTTGSGTEQGIRAAASAVTPPLSITANSGFLRPDADLAVVWLTDEDDSSLGGTTIPDYLAALRSATGNGALRLAAIAGPAPGGCVGPYGTAQAGTRYAALVGSTPGGLLLSYCDDMLGNLLRVSAALFGEDAVTLSAQPAIPTLVVTVNGAAVPRVDAQGNANWAYSLATNQVTFAAPLPQGATVSVTYDAFCLSATCGDGVQDPNELCDDMNAANDDACINCVTAACGDAFVQTGVEECDDGNADQTDACLASCVAATCGDGFLQAGVEECDDGNTVGGDGCPATCRYYAMAGLASAPFTELANGTPITFTGGGNNPNDDGAAQVVLPFGFSFFGAPATSTVTVSPNGYLSFDPPVTAQQSAANAAIPSASAPNALMAAWWEDLLVDPNIQGGSEVSWTVQGAAPARVAIVQWRDVRVANHTTNRHRRFTFQIALEEGTGVIRLAYGTTETAFTAPTQTSASAGIEDATGALGYEALGCSPTCTGPARSAQNPNGFPEQSEVVFTP
ncbi:MAG: choice-of-anchor D domain-containing protein [Myxococcales bacterium]|nr:choice-of-anchor D domain-containing protein [Myxococcales bacterium]MCB9651486.1 choice-of-anchor D domain-containing protein [Deltaproteobacteria bacterium]